MIRMAIAVACGGVVGTLLRFAVATWVSTQWPRHFYLATLAVNLLGMPAHRLPLRHFSRATGHFA